MMALKENVESALEYLEGWLAGHGSARLASGIRNMASAELCRAQLRQWIRHSARLSCGRRVSRYVVECLIRDSLASIELRIGEAEFAASKFFTAAELLLRGGPDAFDILAESLRLRTSFTVTVPEGIGLDRYAEDQSPRRHPTPRRRSTCCQLGADPELQTCAVLSRGHPGFGVVRPTLRSEPPERARGYLPTPKPKPLNWVRGSWGSEPGGA